MKSVSQNCQWVEERLPWFENGSLCSAEHKDIQRHLFDCAGCRVDLEEVRSLVGPSDHPRSEALLQFAWGELSVASAESVDEHLLVCAGCHDTVRMLMEASEQLDTEEPDTGRGGRRSWLVAACLFPLIVVAVLSGLHWSEKESPSAEGSVRSVALSQPDAEPSLLASEDFELGLVGEGAEKRSTTQGRGGR